MSPNPPELSDEALLGTVPDYLSISQMLKATPLVEGGQRYVYLEASNETQDQQDEVILAKALADSSGFFLQFGNLDIDHYTMIGPRLGLANANLYEIGRPLDVKTAAGKTFVKGQIMSGTGPAAQQANIFWSSLVDVSPPQRWYPSVGGSVLEKAVEVDPASRRKRVVIKRTRWCNVGFSKTPVNANVPTVGTVPFGVLAKSFCAAGIDITKALTAGYGTDAAQLSGGAALRTQSLHGAPVTYMVLRDRLSADVSAQVKAGARPSANDLVALASRDYGLPEDEAAEFVERFLRDLRIQLKKKPQ